MTTTTHDERVRSSVRGLVCAAIVLFLAIVGVGPVAATTARTTYSYGGTSNNALRHHVTWGVQPGVSERPEVRVSVRRGGVSGGGARPDEALAGSLPIDASVLAAEEGSGLVEGANGAVRDPATGRFAPNPDRVVPELSDVVHGNSRLSEAPTSLYQLYDLEGNYLKTGITNDPAGRYTQDFMSDKFMDIINVGSRSNMMDLERLIVEYDPGPLNFERWAGAAR